MDVTEKQRASLVAPPSGERRNDIVATDGELLMRFTRHGDQRAFAQIVERHRGLVWIVCREVLGHSPDVEDAFQATFIILAERAGTIRGSDSAAAWLCKVAQRTSLAARRKRARLREESLTADPQRPSEEEFALPDRELIGVLFDELRGLPERYQTPLVLRYMEGQSRRAIADQTDSTVAQIQGRLVRGRRMLRSRMLRRGVSLSLAAGALSASAIEANAAAASTLTSATVSGCLALKTTGAIGGLSAAALQLAKQGAKAMWIASMMKSAAVISTVVAATGIAFAAQRGVGSDDGSGQANAGAKSKQPVIVATDEAGKRSTSEERLGLADAATALADQDRKLAKAIAEQRDKLQVRQSERAGEAANLEMNLLNKKMVQRKLERLSEMELEASLSQGPAAKKELDAEAQKAALAEFDFLTREIESVSKEFKQALHTEAEHSAALEAAQSEVKAMQQRLESLEQARTKLQLQGYAPATAVRSRIDASTGLPQREPLPGATLQLAGPSKNQIGPGDAVLIRVNNALADQPIGDVFYVEPMGTIALGPSYGRVDVSGLSILEAEEAVKKHLATIVQDPQVQLTLAGRAAPTAMVAGVSTYPTVPSAAASAYEPIFDRQNQNTPHHTGANVDQVLIERMEAMNSTIRELRDELAKLKAQSEQKASAQVPTR